MTKRLLHDQKLRELGTTCAECIGTTEELPGCLHAGGSLLPSINYNTYLSHQCTLSFPVSKKLVVHRQSRSLSYALHPPNAAAARCTEHFLFHTDSDGPGERIPNGRSPTVASIPRASRQQLEPSDNHIGTPPQTLGPTRAQCAFRPLQEKNPIKAAVASGLHQ
jgi:hypothetical protein